MDDLPVAGSVSLTPEAVRFSGWAQDCGGAFERRLLLRVSPEASSPVRVLVCGPTTARFELELACSSSPSGSGAAPDQDERALQIRNPEGTADRMFFGLLLPASTTVALIVRFHPPPTGTTDFLWSNFADAITVFAVEGAQSCAAKVTSRVVHMRATRHDEDQTGSAADISSFKPSVALLSLPVLARGALSCLAKSRGGQKDGAAAVGGDGGVGTEDDASSEADAEALAAAQRAVQWHSGSLQEEHQVGMSQGAAPSEVAAQGVDKAGQHALAAVPVDDDFDFNFESAWQSWCLRVQDCEFERAVEARRVLDAQAVQEEKRERAKEEAQAKAQAASAKEAAEKAAEPLPLVHVESMAEARAVVYAMRAVRARKRRDFVREQSVLGGGAAASVPVGAGVSPTRNAMPRGMQSMPPQSAFARATARDAALDCSSSAGALPGSPGGASCFDADITTLNAADPCETSHLSSAVKVESSGLITDRSGAASCASVAPALAMEEREFHALVIRSKEEVVKAKEREQRARLRLLEAGLQRSINDLESVSKASAVEALQHGDCGVDVDVGDDVELGSSVSAALAYADGSPSPHKHGFTSGAFAPSSSSSDDEGEDHVAQRVAVKSKRLVAASASASSQTHSPGKSSSSPAAPAERSNEKLSSRMASLPRTAVAPAVEHSVEEQEFYSDFMKRDQERRARMGKKATPVQQSRSRPHGGELVESGKVGGTKAWVGKAPAGSARGVAAARRAVFAAGDSNRVGHSDSDDSAEDGATKSWPSPTRSLRSAQGQRRQVPSGWAAKHSEEEQRQQQLQQQGPSPQTRQHEQQARQQLRQTPSTHTPAPAPALAHTPVEAPAVDTEPSKVAWVRREYARQLQALSSDAAGGAAEASGTESDEFDPTSAQIRREAVAKVSGERDAGMNMLHSASETQLHLEGRASVPQLSKGSSKPMPVSTKARPEMGAPMVGVHAVQVKGGSAMPKTSQRKYDPAGQKSQGGKRVGAHQQRGTAPAVGGVGAGTASFKPGQRIRVKPRGRRERRAAAAAAAAGQQQF